MKIIIEFNLEIEGELPENLSDYHDEIVEGILNTGGRCVTSEDIDGTEGWGIFVKSYSSKFKE